MLDAYTFYTYHIYFIVYRIQFLIKTQYSFYFQQQMFRPL